jgi:HSP20 family molecular chaperone IbpA
MSISIQVKNGYDAQTSTAYGIGVAPMDGACASATNGYGWCVAPSIQNTHVAYNGGWNGPAFVQNSSFSPSLAHQAWIRNAQLASIVAQVGTFDPRLAGRISAIGATCTGTAIKIGQVATIDKALAFELTRIAEFDPATAVSLATIAVVNPVAARSNLQHGFGGAMKNSVAANQGLGNAIVHDDGSVYRIEAFLPGMDAEDIDISVRNGRLTIKVDGPEYGRNGNTTACTKAFAMGQDVSIDDINATVTNGRLTVVIPRTNIMADAIGNGHVCRTVATV